MPTIPAAGRVTSATVHALFSEVAWMRALPVMGSRTGSLLAQVAVFDVRDGRLVAANPLAQALGQAGRGARLVSRVEGALGVEAPRAHLSEVVVVDPQGAKEQRPSSAQLQRSARSLGLATALAQLGDMLSSMGAKDRADFERDIRAGGRVARGVVRSTIERGIDAMDAAVIGRDRMVLSPEMAVVLTGERAIAPRTGTRYAAEVLAHEFEHTVTPENANSPAGRRLAWLEEGVADALARWPGVAQRFAAAMGIDAPPPAPRLDARLAYDRMTAVVRRLLALAGVDVGRTDQLDRARELLQGAPLAQVPRRLALAIAERHGLPADRVPAIERAIRRLDGQLAAVARLERSLARG